MHLIAVLDINLGIILDGNGENYRTIKTRELYKSCMKQNASSVVTVVLTAGPAFISNSNLLQGYPGPDLESKSSFYLQYVHFARANNEKMEMGMFLGPNETKRFWEWNKLG